ncbi:hypothetical protein BWI17_13465 [Betaproteobacteria bacterium GR16-43]|nr:hypothetical protein BWI17_13465 [Betaproteobacteria bacterium GR16-43]
MNRKLIAFLVANALAAPAALAQEASNFRISGTVGVGGISVDDKDALDASKLNEYMDLSSGLLTIFDVKGRGSRYWFDLFGENLGRDDQYIAARGGAYDTFKYRLWTDALKHNFLFNGRTPYAGAGSTVQTATFPRVDPAAWNSLDEGYKRRDDGFSFEWQKAAPWYARVEANQVTWSGTKSGASSQGGSPGNGFVELAFPVEYKTRNALAEAGYNTPSMHFDLSWMASKFENDNESFTWTNGYLGNAADRTYLAADNRYQRLAGNATFRFLPLGTTLAARFTSDELKSSTEIGTSFLSGTNGSSTQSGPSQSSFNGKIRNETFTASAASAPLAGLDTRLYYNYRKRDEDSSVITFATGEVTEPFSYKKNNWGFDGYYRLNRGNRIGAGYDYLDTKREGRDDFDRTKDKRFFAEWRNTTLDDLAARLKYTRLERDANFLHANDGTNPNDSAYLNRYVTAFDLSNVDQDQWKLTLDYTLLDNIDFGFEGTIKNNKYKDNTLGRLEDDRRELYLSASYGVPGGPRFSVFGDWEEVKVDSRHRIIGSGGVDNSYDPNSPPTSANYNWTGNIKDNSYAGGIAVDWPATEKLAIKASAIYYKTNGYVDLSLQQGVPASVTPPVPIGSWDDSKRISLNIKAVYALNKAWTLTGGYAYERWEYSDSQTDGYRYIVTNSNATQNAYLNGVGAFTQYKSNIIYGLVNYRF